MNPSARNYFLFAGFIRDAESIDSEKSIHFYQLALKLNPIFPCAHNNFAGIFYQNDDFKMAIEHYRKAVEIDRHHWAYRMIGVCYRRLGKLKKAIYWLNLGRAIHNKDRDYQYQLGIAYYKNGNYKKAIKHLDDLVNTGYEYESSTLNYIDYSKSDYTRQLIERSARIENDKKKFTYIKDRLKWSKITDELATNYLESFLSFHSEYKKNDLSYRTKYFKRILEEQESGPDANIYSNLKNLHVYDEDTVMSFGRYEGKTIEFLINNDVDYLLWCIINLANFVVPNTVLCKSDFMIYGFSLKAVTYNIAKHKILPLVESVEDFTDDSYFVEDNDHGWSTPDSNPYYNDALDMDQQKS